MGRRCGSSPSYPITLIKNKRRSEMKVFLEIFAAEGGDDAKLLVDNHVSAYVKACSRNLL
jgi:protein subunit release factor A